MNTRLLINLAKTLFDLFHLCSSSAVDFFKMGSAVRLWWRIRDNVKNLTISVGPDGDGFL